MGIVGKPLYTNEAIAGINTKNKEILLNKYIYYYLQNMDMNNIGMGILGNGSLNKQTLGEINITYSTLEHQNEIIKSCEYNDDLIKTLKNEIKQNNENVKNYLNNILSN